MSAPGTVNSTIVVPTTVISSSGSSTITSVSSSTSVIETPTPTPTPSTSIPVTTPSSVVPPVTTSSSSLTTISTPTTSSTLITTTSSTPTVITSVVIQTPPNGAAPTTVIVSVTTNVPETLTTSVPTTTSAAVTTSAVPVGDTGNNQTSSTGIKASVIAPAVIVPIVVIALAVVLGIFFWRRRKQRREGEELRKKEMEEYSYNPNNDPTIPVAGALSSTGGDDHAEGGYRGWGTTSSTARKASTTLGGSSAPIGIARSNSGGQNFDGNYSPNGVSPERHPSDPMVAPGSPEGLGALGAAPLAGSNRNQSGINRGVSNASSAYSGGQRSDHSDNGPAGYAGSPQYYDEFMQPEEQGHTIDGAWGGQPIIKDVSARRNTRIENPAIFPQPGNAGISQNF